MITPLKIYKMVIPQTTILRGQVPLAIVAQPLQIIIPVTAANRDAYGNGNVMFASSCHLKCSLMLPN